MVVYNFNSGAVACNYVETGRSLLSSIWPEPKKVKISAAGPATFVYCGGANRAHFWAFGVIRESIIRANQSAG